MQNEDGISERKPARNYRDPNDRAKRRKTAPVDETNEKVRHSDAQNPPRDNPLNVEKPGGSEQPGYRMKRARFWQS